MKQTAGTVVMIVVQLALLSAFIYCANTAHLFFPLREPAAREKLQLYLSLKGFLWGLYVIALHATAVLACLIYRSRCWRGFAWLNICSLIVFCLSVGIELLLGYAYFKPISELIQFSVLLLSVNLFYLFLLFSSKVLVLLHNKKRSRDKVP